MAINTANPMAEIEAARNAQSSVFLQRTEERGATIGNWLQEVWPDNGFSPSTKHPTDRGEFFKFLINNPAWFELAKQYPMILVAMADVYPMLAHIELLDEEGGGISRGVRAKEAIGVILAAWEVLRGEKPDINLVRKFFPENLQDRRAQKREDWNKIGEGFVNSGLLQWLAAAPISGNKSASQSHYDDGSYPGVHQILSAVVKIKDQLTPDLMRRLQNKGEHEIFQMVLVRLGSQAGMAVANNPAFTLRRLAGQQVRRESTDPKILKNLTALVEAETAAGGLDKMRRYGHEKTGAKLDMETLNDELRQIKDAYLAAPETFHQAESFARWFELADEFHRNLRDLDRKKELSVAWQQFKKFPAANMEGYRSRDLLIMPLRDNVALSLEGVLRKHCVGGYSHACMNKTVAIYSVRNGRGESIGTLEVRQSGDTGMVMNQFRGFQNRRIGEDLTKSVQEIINGAKEELAASKEVEAAYEKVAKACLKNQGGGRQQPKDLLLAMVEAGLLAGKTGTEIVAKIDELAEPLEQVEIKKYLVARGADFIATEAEANALGALKATINPEGKNNGVMVDPLRLLIARIEENLRQGKGLKEVLEAIQKQLPEEGSEFFGYFYRIALEVAKTPEQEESIRAALEIVPSLAQEAEATDAQKSRWEGLTAPRKAKGAQSPELVLGYIEEVLPKAREAAVKKALGESEELELEVVETKPKKTRKLKQ